ncbi:unnamed protein product [Arabidopsis thaliana]|uniref:Uncharacterized protein n=1 Tax=Arabidopsis thaliana TaxID=3702 RepID=A0A654FLS3_ARATH|nr:unnamed protein product [Arabidopsis thaliana]
MVGGRGKPGGKGRRSVKKQEEKEVERGRDEFLSKSKTPHPKGFPPMQDLSTNVVTNRGGLQPMKELWDVEYVHIPKKLSLKTVLDNMKQTMAQRGFYIRSVDAYVRKRFLTENKPLIKRLR